VHSFRKEKKLGSVEEAAQAEPVRRSEKETHEIKGMESETVHAQCQNAVWTQSVF
jgi:hypothetical protein